MSLTKNYRPALVLVLVFILISFCIDRYNNLMDYIKI